MEEKVGELWHRLITRMAQVQHPAAAVSLQQVSRTVQILFRALGGDAGLRVTAAHATEHGGRRRLLQRIAGNAKRVQLAWCDEQALHLPAVIDLFPDPQLNRDLYLWLAALAVGDRQDEEPWFRKNQRLTRRVLSEYPGLRSRYQRLVTAHLRQRMQPDPRLLAEIDQEQAIRQALLEPGSIDRLPPAKRPPQPVPLWLHPSPPAPQPSRASEGEDGNPNLDRRASNELQQDQSYLAERAEQAEANNRGLITIRMENILTWGGFLKLDRGSEEQDDLEQAAATLKDLEQISVSRDARATAGKLRFDLDLPAASEDDLPLSEGILLPEWNYKKHQLQPDHCRLIPLLAAHAQPIPLPPHLRGTANRLRAQFQQLMPARSWHRQQQEGNEIDLDAYLRFAAERSSGHASADGLYRDLRSGARDLACLLLADLSLSTDSWIDNHARVIDVIRDSLFLFGESLAATGDRFAIYGFSSRKRDPIRFHQLKTFEERYSSVVRGRIAAIKPGFYTRMGAAIRQANRLLETQPAQRRLLLILTDGKPNDLDNYEGRYGIEDTRQAIRESRTAGLQPFCVTIDRKANDYLPHLFGTGSYILIHKPSQLPKELPLLYARLTT